MMIPKIEDGNNFGVGIQEDVLSEVGKSEADAGSYLEQLSRYTFSFITLVSSTVYTCGYCTVVFLYWSLIQVLHLKGKNPFKVCKVPILGEYMYIV